jgi:hypothetical protein
MIFFCQTEKGGHRENDEKGEPAISPANMDSRVERAWLPLRDRMMIPFVLS